MAGNQEPMEKKRAWTAVRAGILAYLSHRMANGAAGPLIASSPAKER